MSEITRAKVEDMKEIMWQDIMNRLREITYLERVLALLSWDQETFMPPAGARARSEEMSLVVGLWHEKMCDPWWDEALPTLLSSSDISEEQKRLLEVFQRDRNKEVKIPTSLAVSLAKAVSEAFQVWYEAKKNSDFSLFLPSLERVFSLSLEKASALGYDEQSAYDAFLDLHEENLTEAEFDPLASQTKDIIQRVLASLIEKGTPPRKDFLSRFYPKEKQQWLGKWLLPQIGFDLNRGRLDVSPHPFSTTLALDDVRLTTRYDEHDPTVALYGVLHEAGHGLYEQGFLPEWEYTPFAQAVSLGIHESQSRFWENQIGRSYEFLCWIWPMMKEAFGEILSDVSPEEFFRAVNEVKPSLIRTEADEVTYGLHILVRYEVEKRLFHRDISLRETRDLWNELYKAYIGVEVLSDDQGILQDIHWAHGSFGYFPTYLLGNLYAAQWYSTMEKSLNVSELVTRGEFRPLLQWMRENIHQHGHRYDAKTLALRISGETLQPAHFARYLKKRYESVYGIAVDINGLS